VSALSEADEVFLAGTTCGIIGIVKIDGKDIGTGTEGPVTKAVRERFNALTRGG
jgi:branched-subunit amino acid aminotransferase/4-amino-4-deoxychorismate lyase